MWLVHEFRCSLHVYLFTCFLFKVQFVRLSWSKRERERERETYSADRVLQEKQWRLVFIWYLSTANVLTLATCRGDSRIKLALDFKRKKERDKNKERKDQHETSNATRTRSPSLRVHMWKCAREKECNLSFSRGSRTCSLSLSLSFFCSFFFSLSFSSLSSRICSSRCALFLSSLQLRYLLSIPFGLCRCDSSGSSCAISNSSSHDPLRCHNCMEWRGI